MAEIDYRCDHCHIGTRNLRHSSVTYWVEGQLVILPDVPVWVCDICGDVEYEMENISKLERLLGIDRSFSSARQNVDAAFNPDDLTSLLSTTRRRSV